MVGSKEGSNCCKLHISLALHHVHISIMKVFSLKAGILASVLMNFSVNSVALNTRHDDAALDSSRLFNSSFGLIGRNETFDYVVSSILIRYYSVSMPIYFHR